VGGMDSIIYHEIRLCSNFLSVSFLCREIGETYLVSIEGERGRETIFEYDLVVKLLT